MIEKTTNFQANQNKNERNKYLENKIYNYNAAQMNN
jgi:hypothetical protein